MCARHGGPSVAVVGAGAVASVVGSGSSDRALAAQGSDVRIGGLFYKD